MKKPFVVGITGCSGSGKTFLLSKLINAFDQSDISVISMDNYYKPVEEQVRDENGVIHFDLPESIDEAGFEADLKKLVAGTPIQVKEYTFNVHDREPELITIDPKPIIVVEGIFTFLYTGVNDLLDSRVFVDASEEVMLQRRIKRDEVERGYHDQSVRYRFESHVLPIYRERVLPLRVTADFIINNEENPLEDLSRVISYLKTVLSR